MKAMQTVSVYRQHWLSLLGSLLLLFTACNSSERQVIWQMGVVNQSSNEFALAPDQYKDFLGHDFGWEDRFFLVGKSDIATDWPYILPGPDDAWGGTGPTSGLRTHVLNILFGIEKLPKKGDWLLSIDLNKVNVSPLFKVIVNGQAWKFQLNDSDTVKKIRIPLGQGLIRKGGNEIRLTNIEGSWLTFDAITLEGPAGVSIQQNNQTAFVREVRLSDYELQATDGEKAQPLLVDVEHLEGTPLLEVKVDNDVLLEQTLEQGRYVLEVPLPAVYATQESKYVVSINGKTVESGKVTRSPQPLHTLANYVDTRMGTAHSRWMIAPGPWMPFGMVKLSPDNQNAGWQAGYDPSFESVGTFSHIHEWTMGGLGIMPVNGVLQTEIGNQTQGSKGYRSEIDKSTEEAPLGYYKVDLLRYGIKAELTATTRCGFLRFTYPEGTDSRVMIDLQVPAEYAYKILEAEIRQVGTTRIEGHSKLQVKNAWSGGVDQDYTVYFVLDFDQEIKKFGGWVNDTRTENQPIVCKEANKAGGYVEFDTRNNPVVQVRSGISYVDLAGARFNLEQEVATPFGWNFEAVRQNQVSTWNDLFERLQVRSNDQREKMRFYTNLYRSYCRNIFSDVDGRWVDATEQVQKFTDPDAVALGCDAFWNTFWNLNQLWNLATPEWSSRWVKSQLGMYDANGWLAKGPAGMEYIPVMVAEHEIPLLVSAYQMGIRNYDSEKLFKAVKKMQTTLPQVVGNGLVGNRDLAAYLRYHYVPADKGRFSNTLEYSFDDWTVGQLAKALGKEEDYKVFSDRGNWWRNAIEPDSGYAHLRNADGSWQANFDPFRSGANHHYVEGNAWQLTFFVPQDVPALAEAIGKQRFIDRLTWGFKASEPWRYNAPGDQYWDFPVVQGNQQSMHFAFLFNWVGEPWQTQQWTRSILDRYYGFDIANAYLGDEDQGQMSAWFVMAALGLFQTDGGCRVEPVYEIASPLFNKVMIDLGERFDRGKTFVIEARGTSRKNKYVQSASLNGKQLDSFKFSAKELLQGGTLMLEMGPEPNKAWGTAF